MPVRIRDLQARLDLCERLAGGFLLRILLRAPLAAAKLLSIDDGGTREAAVVRRALGRQLRVQHAPAGPGEELLEVGLRIDPGGNGSLDVLGERVDDRRFDRCEAMLEEERSERRLEDGADDTRSGTESP